MKRRTINSSNCHLRLDRLKIVDAVASMADQLGLMGSAGPVNLYEVIVAYLTDLDKRAAINRIINWQSS